MPIEPITLRVPHDFAAELYYADVFPAGGIFGYIQIIRSKGTFRHYNWQEIEDNYYWALERLRTTFAGTLDATVDLLIDPPSNRD